MHVLYADLRSSLGRSRHGVHMAQAPGSVYSIVLATHQALKQMIESRRADRCLLELTQFGDVLEKSTNQSSIWALALAETLLEPLPAWLLGVRCRLSEQAVHANRPLPHLILMDFGEGIKHEVAVKVINVRHLIDVSPGTLSLAKELRYCIIALVLGVGITTITRSYLASRNRN